VKNKDVQSAISAYFKIARIKCGRQYSKMSPGIHPERHMGEAHKKEAAFRNR